MRLGSYLLFCGRTTDGMRYIDEAIAQDPIDGRKFMLRCSGHLNIGNVAKAIADGRRAVFMGYSDIFFKTIGRAVSLGNMGCLISLWADIEPIRQIWQHPEFIPFAERIGMAAAWDKYGRPDLLPSPNDLSVASN